eukprot:c34482_g1_i1 orf=2-190(-)
MLFTNRLEDFEYSWNYKFEFRKSQDSCFNLYIKSLALAASVVCMCSRRERDAAYKRWLLLLLN